MAKAAGNKRVTIIPTIHGKLTYDHKVCEPDVTWTIEKWLYRHPEIRKRQHEIRALSGRWTTADGLKTEVSLAYRKRNASRRQFRPRISFNESLSMSRPNPFSVPI